MTTLSQTQPSTAHNAATQHQQELSLALSRLRQLGGAVAVEEFSRAIGDNSPFADEVDHIQASASRDIGLATRGLLVERVNRLSAALRRLHQGEYGLCTECGASVSADRLHAMPEAQTCVRCQDTIERRGRHLAHSARSAFALRDDGEMSAESDVPVPSVFLDVGEHRVRLLS
jgi:DnaK suppressor protein